MSVLKKSFGTFCRSLTLNKPVSVKYTHIISVLSVFFISQTFASADVLIPYVNVLFKGQIYKFRFTKQIISIGCYKKLDVVLLRSTVPTF